MEALHAPQSTVHQKVTREAVLSMGCTLWDEILVVGAGSMPRAVGAHDLTARS